MNEDRINENQIYSNGREELFLLSEIGDHDAVKIARELGPEEKSDDMAGTTEPDRALQVKTEARYEIFNRAALSAVCGRVADLFCGFRPRSFRMSSAGKRYFGMDRPEVIREMRPAARKSMTTDQKVLSSYHGVDILNYEALREALGEERGRLCIVTEKIPESFGRDELTALCGNVFRILKEFGGCWIAAEKSIGEICGEGTGEQKASGSGEETGKQKTGGSCGEKAEKFLKEQGFAVEKHSAGEFLPEKMRSADPESLRAEYEKQGIWFMMAELMPR